MRQDTVTIGWLIQLVRHLTHLFCHLSNVDPHYRSDADKTTQDEQRMPSICHPPVTSETPLIFKSNFPIVPTARLRIIMAITIATHHTILTPTKATRPTVVIPIKHRTTSEGCSVPPPQ